MASDIPLSGHLPRKKRKKAYRTHHSKDLGFRNAKREAKSVPFTKRRLSWQDAMRYQGYHDVAFHLPEEVHLQLQQHFCTGTFDALKYEVQCMFSEAATLRSKVHDVRGVNETRTSLTVDVLTDTLFMIVYFRTHQAAEENAWSLIMDKAEDAVFAGLGLDENTEEQLAPLYSLLELSMEHAHFEQAFKDALTEHENTLLSNEKPAPAAKTCPVCKKSFNGEDEMGAGEMTFKCLSDACYLGDQDRRHWETWDKCWDHQVQSSHMICPKGAGLENKVEDDL
ncbi:hypothetical protein F4810DRAFT_323053 [Camillea tinctor]|nr:hypothetical protein F4810DRAFT_323053 [Camillea tinctor]